MNKDLVKSIIAEYQRNIVSIPYIPRNQDFEDNLNYVLVGLRRAGKSYLLYQQINNLLAAGHDIQEILYFNFEDDRLENTSIADLDLIKTAFEEMYDTKPIFFLDEIQIVEGWEKFVRRLADQKYRVYITGSNAKMLSSEIATTLGGRYVIKEVFPYSFDEYLKANGIDLSKKNARFDKWKEIQKLFETYFQYGGLPETVDVKDKRSWLSGLFGKLFFGDLVARHAIRNEFILKLLVKKLAENVKQPSSYNRLANVVSSTGKKISVSTVIDYLTYMQESWLLLPYENIAAKFANKESNKKYYFIDNGILNLFLFDANTFLLENMVAIRLRQLFANGAYFYNDKIEVDFYVPDEKLAIQVLYSLNDSETRKRETSALIKMSKRFELDNMLIITKEEEETIQMEDKIISVVPLWKWLLE